MLHREISSIHQGKLRTDAGLYQESKDSLGLIGVEMFVSCYHVMYNRTGAPHAAVTGLIEDRRNEEIVYSSKPAIIPNIINNEAIRKDSPFQQVANCET